MLRNFMERQGPGAGEGGTNGTPKPGDFELGSLESRAAARTMLEGRHQPGICLIVHVIGKPLHLENSTCTRTRWADGTVFDCVLLDGCGEDLDSAHLDRVISKLPIDGKKYPLAQPSSD